MWLRIRRRVLAARWWISRVVRLASWILAKCVICIEIGHLFHSGTEDDVGDFQLYVTSWQVSLWVWMDELLMTVV